MQAHDLSCNLSLAFHASDLPVMSEHSSPICSPNHHSLKNLENVNTHVENNTDNGNNEDNRVNNSSFSNNNGTSSEFVRRQRPSRACTQRAAARMQAAAEAEAAMAETERKKKAMRRERLTARLLNEESEEEEQFVKLEGVNEENGEVDGSTSSSLVQCSKIVTKLVGDPEPSQFLRWSVRSMWQLASILNFLNVFRSLLNIKVEFSG